MRKTTSGFTIIELVVVITVIGILTALGTFSFLRVQVNSRDSQRSAKITLISEALEKYYGLKGEYPSCADMTQPIDTVVANTLTGLRSDALTTPTAAIGTNSILSNCADMAPGYTADKFAYVGVNNTNCLTTPCLRWTLKYREEATGNIISLSSLRTALEHTLTTTTYTTVGTITFTVPADVKTVKMEAHGGQGGRGSTNGHAGCVLLAGGVGGLGGKVVGTINVVQGDQLVVVVGAKGTDPANNCNPITGGTGGSSTVTRSGTLLVSAYGGLGGTGSYQVCTGGYDPYYTSYCLGYTAYVGTPGAVGSGASYVSGGIVTNGGANFGNAGRVILTY